MHLWKSVLWADTSYGLGDPGQGRDWFTRLEWFWKAMEFGQTSVPPGADVAPMTFEPAWWPPALSETWVRSILALRSLALRLHPGVLRELKIKKPTENYGREVPGTDADLLFRNYLSYLRPELRVKPGSEAGDLTNKTLYGIRLKAHLPDDVRQRLVTANTPMLAYTVERFYVFWISVFGSFVIDDVAPICAACGAELSPTKAGGLARRKFCFRCRYREYREDAKARSIETVRKKERERKARQRASAKSTTKRKGK